VSLRGQTSESGRTVSFPVLRTLQAGDDGHLGQHCMLSRVQSSHGLAVFSCRPSSAYLCCRSWPRQPQVLCISRGGFCFGFIMPGERQESHANRLLQPTSDIMIECWRHGRHWRHFFRGPQGVVSRGFAGNTYARLARPDKWSQDSVSCVSSLNAGVSAGGESVSSEGRRCLPQVSLPGPETLEVSPGMSRINRVYLSGLAKSTVVPVARRAGAT
jgi:hypothetical protein